MKNSIVPIFNAEVVQVKISEGHNSELLFANTKMLQQYLHSMMGKQVQVSIRLKRKSRSNNQNKYYWGVVVALIADYTGMTIDETHEALKNKFLKAKKAVKRGGKLIWEVDTVRSTAGLSTGEFEAYIADIKLFAVQQLGLVIPNPNEIDLERM